MDKRLFDAAYKGDVSALNLLQQEDPHLMDRSYLDCEYKNVLHISAMKGRVEFVEAISQAVDSSTFYQMSLARDREGRNPVHCAAINGQENILELIIKHDEFMQAAMEKADEGGTILHLCVKYKQLGALNLLLRILADSELIVAKNQDGMTIMHLAFVYNKDKRRQEIILHLLENTPEIVNECNANGKTVLDIYLSQAKRSLDYFESFFPGNTRSSQDCEDILHYSLLMSPALTGDVISKLRTRSMSSEFFEKSEDSIMVVASIIAAMAFQGMVNPPGGFWQDDSSSTGTKPHTAGESVTSQNQPWLYLMLSLSNTIAFASSMTSILLLLLRGPVDRFNCSKVMFWLLVLVTAMFLAVTGITVAYAISLVMIAPESIKGRWCAPTAVAIVLIIVWCFPLYYYSQFWYQMRLSPKTRRLLKITKDGKIKPQF